MKRASGRAAIILALIAGPVGAVAGPRIVVPHVAGDRSGALSKRIAAALCEPLECAPKSSAYTGSRPNFAKARRNGVSGIVFGALAGNEPNRHLWLALFTASTVPDRTWTVPLRRNGLVARHSLEAIVREIERRLAPATPVLPGTSQSPVRAPPPPPPPTLAPQAPGPSERPAAVSIAPHPAPAIGSPGVAAPPGAAPPRPVPLPPVPIARAAPAPEQPRWAAVELGAYLTSRSLDYRGASPPGTSPLQQMQADAILCPRAYLEVFPAAGLALRPLAGLGAFADYRRSIGFEVRAASERHSAQLGHLSTGVVWHLPPLTGWQLVFSPAVSYERRDVTASGTIPGFPDAHLRGARFGARMALPFGTRYALLLGAGYVRWSSAGDLVRGDVPFFPSGSARAVEAEAGFSIGLFGRYSARIVGEYASTSYTLDPDPTGTYRASGATDRSAGVRGSIRAEF